MPIAAIVLAAGASRRLGRPKQIEPWGETTLLGHVVAQTRRLPVDEVWVVLGHEMDAVMSNIDLEGCGVVENPEWEEGIASSLRVGLDAINRMSDADAALIVIGDQPQIDGEIVEAMIESHRKVGLPVTIPKYRYAWGNPVLVDRSLWPRLMSLEGDDGAKRFFQAHPQWVNELWSPSPPPRDVDTEDDIAELRPRLPG